MIKYLNKTCLSGGDNNDILYLKTSDSCLAFTKPSQGPNFKKLLCSNIDFLELSNHDIIFSYRAIGFISKNNPNIKYNRKIFSSLSKDQRKASNEQIKYLLAQKRNSTHFNNLFIGNDSIQQKYNKENFYEISMKYSFSSNEAIANKNQIETFKISDKPFKYSKIGFISLNNKSILYTILSVYSKTFSIMNKTFFLNYFNNKFHKC